MEEKDKNRLLFEIQPAACRAPLPPKEIIFTESQNKHMTTRKREAMLRVLSFDPTELYDRISHLIDPNKRHQGLQMEQVFPTRRDGQCTCGCGEPTELYNEKGTLHRKYANDSCQSFCSDVLSIINNYFKVPGKYITLYHGDRCIKCKRPSGWNYHDGHQAYINLELDHIIPVKHGGGGSWLSNYEWKCKDCHREKTNKDFGFKTDKTAPNQLKLNIITIITPTETNDEQKD